MIVHDSFVLEMIAYLKSFVGTLARNRSEENSESVDSDPTTQQSFSRCDIISTDSKKNGYR